MGAGIFREEGEAMLIERLRSRRGFSDSEEKVADYLLAHGSQISQLSISRLAELCYTSPATVTRLCRKLGTSGYTEFRILLSAEFAKLEDTSHVDVNLPFGAEESIRDVAQRIANLQRAGIEEAHAAFDYDRLRSVVRHLADSDVVNVYTMGNSLPAAMDFKIKLVRLGRQVNVEQDSSILPGYAMAAGRRSFNLLISQSGRTLRILECARVLRKKGRYCVAVTSDASSELAGLCDAVLLTQTGESDLYSMKIETFASFMATHYILDCLYSWLFQTDYERNVERSKQSLGMIRAQRMLDSDQMGPMGSLD